MGDASFDLAPGVPIGDGCEPILIAGPCVIESEEMVFEVACGVKEIAARHDIPVVFKTSFDKANRSSGGSFRGPGLEPGLAVLAHLREETRLPVLTDIHEPWQAMIAAEVADVLQVPAFLCRQTDLLLACGRTGAAVNIKKGQFMAPEDMRNAVAKVRDTDNDRVTITERGSCFGYNNLVVDMRGLPMMRRFAPVIFDVTHSLQLPGGLGHATGGVRELHPYLARAAAAAGVDGFFVEVHPDPARARSDATTQLTLEELDRLLGQLKAITGALREVGQ
jgi:2-dehydro-3-deoxyphosphooctonate aldolase (KDO 8-P synthase)